MVNGLCRSNHACRYGVRLAGVQVARVVRKHLAFDDDAEAPAFLKPVRRVPKIYYGFICLTGLQQRRRVPAAQVAGADLARQSDQTHLPLFVGID